MNKSLEISLNLALLPGVIGLALIAGVTPAHAQTPLPDDFNPGASSSVLSMAVQADGKILVGGSFTMLGGQPRGGIGRLNADGTVDTTFNPGGGGAVLSLAVQADGKILVGGSFGTLGGETRHNIGRLNGDGTLDSTFNPGANFRVYALTLQADGRILVAGSFLELGGQWRFCIGRLNADGTLDDTFDPEPDNTVLTLALQGDGKILVGGYFRTLGGQARTNIARLSADGTLDAEFNPEVAGNLLPPDQSPSSVSSLVVQADGKILVGGNFTMLAGQPRNGCGRLNADGTLDGTFTNDSGASRTLQADGKMLVGGTYVRRLNLDGTLDATFNAGAGGSRPSVRSLVLQADGKVLVGGLFTTLGGQPRTNIARLRNTEPATQSLTYDGSTITWLRGGTSPEVWRTAFETSTDPMTWADLGAGQRIPGGWQLTNVVVQAGTTIRARGFVAGGGMGEGIVETTLRVLPLILTGDGSFGVRSNQFGFNLSGLPGQVVVVEGSTNLLQWLPLQTNTLGSSPVYFSDPNWLQNSKRFYRARVQ